MKAKLNWRIGLIPALLVVCCLAVFMTSCKEDPIPPKAVVTVIEWIPTDTIPYSQPVVNAKVWFIPPAGASQPDVIANTTTPRLTDARGQVNYQLTYESVIDIKVEHEVEGVKRFGYGTLVFTENEIYYDTIQLNNLK